MSAEKKFKKGSQAGAARDVGDVYVPKDASDMNLAELVEEVDNLRTKAAQLSFCQVLFRLEEILKLFAGSVVPDAQKRLVTLMENGADDDKRAIQHSILSLVRDITVHDSYNEELSTLTKPEVLKVIIVESHIKHLFGLMALRMKIFRGTKKANPEADVPFRPIESAKLDDLKVLVKREFTRYPIDELVEVISDETERERYKSAVHDALNEVGAGAGRIEAVHLTLLEDYCVPWRNLWRKILSAENPFAKLQSCPVCLENCEAQTVLIATDSCNDTFCLKCAVQSFGSGGMRRTCPLCKAQVVYWTTNQEFDKLRELKEKQSKKE